MFENTKKLIRIRLSKDRQYNGQTKRTKGQIIFCFFGIIRNFKFNQQVTNIFTLCIKYCIGGVVIFSLSF
jgi:hypothetical protein